MSKIIPMYSKIDETYRLTKDSYCLTRLTHPRKNRQGNWGILIIESIDSDDQPVIIQVSHGFHPYDSYQVSLLTPEQLKQIKSGSSTTSYSASKKQVDGTELGKILKDTAKTPFNPNEESSFQRINQLLHQANLISSCSHDPVGIDTNYPMRWNPFARLNESKYFPQARILRPSLWRRIKDTFFIINGDFALWKNKLGILDYLFPWPRLLLTAGKNVPELAQVVLVIIALPLMIARLAAGAFLTIAALPIVFLLDIATLFVTSPKQDNIDRIKIKPIHGEFEDIADINVFDEDKEIALSSYEVFLHSFQIKPIKKIAGHYEVITLQNPKQDAEPLALALFQKGKPKGVIDITAENHEGIYNLLELNQGKVDTYLEKTNTMDEVLRQIGHPR